MKRRDRVQRRGAMERKRIRRAFVRERKGDREGGWTFIETLIVLGIVLILTGSVGFMAVRYLQKAKEVGAKSSIENMSIALQAYYLDCGRYPTPEQGLDSLWEKPRMEPVPTGWNGPYLTMRIPADPWGNVFEYVVPGPNNLPFGIRSLGADGREGGEGSDKDVTSW